MRQSACHFVRWHKVKHFSAHLYNNKYSISRKRTKWTKKWTKWTEKWTKMGSQKDWNMRGIIIQNVLSLQQVTTRSSG